ncbi:MAG: polyphosphate kinase 1 [Chloroflexi bacterium]|nr:polyphosphate kinase 1 [Chloroflexota bacterium]
MADEQKIDLENPALYINRELSMLEYFRRILEEAQDDRNPLLERVKFLAFVGINMDEFFMVRVAGLKQQLAAGVVDIPADGMTAAEQLAAIRKMAASLMNDARKCWYSDIKPKLDEAGIHVLEYKELNDSQREKVEEHFQEVVFPVLTPLAFDPGRPFPHISNLSLSLAVIVQEKKGQQRFARVKVPDTLPRLVPIKRSSGGVRKDGTVPFHHYFVWLDQVIAANLHTLFPGMKVVEAHPFRVMVRMSINEAMPARIRDLLIENLEMDRNDVYSIDGQLGFSSLMTLYSIARYDLKEVPFVPATPKVLDGRYDDGNIFAAIRREDILLHHPYDSFMPVVDFLKTAAHDPDVLAIKQTLYRVGRNAPVVEALLEASLNNKQVAVLVELKARFDEESNITWARALEAEGVHVVYGLLGLKTHSKIALVIRKEGDSIRRYIHVSTGNYNTQTAQTYTDIGMFTCDKEIGADATDLFNYLTGYSEKTNFRKLIVAPINMRARMEALIKREIEQQRKNKRGQLIFKINSLVDKGMIQLLYQASQAGVKIDLLVRGMCCLRPGVPGVSDNIKVTSIVGRFLEHSRIFYFRNGGEEEVYVGSADLMPRNIDRRVEILFPVQDARLIKHLRDEVLATYLADAAKARSLQPDGSYTRIKKSERESGLNSQARLLMHRPIEGKEKEKEKK